MICATLRDSAVDDGEFNVGNSWLDFHAAKINSRRSIKSIGGSMIYFIGKLWLCYKREVMKTFTRAAVEMNRKKEMSI
jgi:hypothetical protein